MEHLNVYWNPYPEAPYQVRYDGNPWTYIGHMGGGNAGGSALGCEKSLNHGSGGTYSHYSYHFGGFAYRPMMYDSQINICEKLIGHGKLNEKEKEIAADMIQNGFLENAGGNIRICVPYFTFSQKEQFDRLAEEYFQEFMPKYAEALRKYADGFRKLFPKHLQQEANQAVYFLFVNFYVKIVTAAQEKDLIGVPGDGQICDALIQFRRV